MYHIKHRFHNRQIPEDIKILVVGTFNPETPGNDADFFYGRNRNHLWKLIPLAFGEASLKGKDKKLKQEFISRNKIGFIDIISEVFVDDPVNYQDDYIDNRVTKWRDVISIMNQLPQLEKVCFTRKTFSGIPNIKKQVEAIRLYCKARKIVFECLPTPARIYSSEKQSIWSSFFSN